VGPRGGTEGADARRTSPHIDAPVGDTILRISQRFPIEMPECPDVSMDVPTVLDFVAADRTRRSRRPLWWAGTVSTIAVTAAAVAAAVGIALSPASATRVVSSLEPAPAPSYAVGQVVPPYGAAMPDPAVMVGAHTDYLYTGADGADPPNVPVRGFTDIEHLGAPSDAMPTLPPWTTGWIWAPDVRFVHGRYVMWFAAPDVHDVLPTGAQAKCIGVATASSPLGPFLAGSQPVICDPWGSIDARTFVAPDGELWLDWKSDVNAAWGPQQNPDLPANAPTVLWAQRLAPDGTTLEGSPQELLAADRPWEHKLIEAPDMVYAEHHYYLFFSANPSYQDGDGIGMAVCQGPAGPCQEPYAGPILGSSPLGLGPGEESLFAQHGVTWLLFSPNGTRLYRQAAIARIAFSRDGPYVSVFDGAVPGSAARSRSA
jgi:hypothetical protein